MHYRKLWLGLLTVLGLARKGFFIPYRFADTLPTPGSVPSYSIIEDLFEKASPIFETVLADASKFSSDLKAIDGQSPPEPKWTQSWFPTLDAAIAYTLVRTQKPKRIIEIGSGHSTRFLFRAAKDGAQNTHITAIDPEPSRGVENLNIDFHPNTIREIDLKIFESLRFGDILFIDSSHVVVPGSDVDDLINRIIPSLPVGILIHIHDIFLPDDYPPEWDWRGYNEQQIIAPLLTSGAYQAIFSSHYLATRMGDKIKNSLISDLPNLDDGLPSSLWLKKLPAK